MIAQLEQKGLVAATSSPTPLELLDRRQVRRDLPEVQAIAEQMRRLVLDNTAMDTRAVAVLMLFAWSTYYRSVGWQLDTGIYQLFVPQEYGQLRAYLRSLRRGDPAITAQVGPDLFAQLRAIAVGVSVAH